MDIKETGKQVPWRVDSQINLLLIFKESQCDLDDNFDCNLLCISSMLLNFNLGDLHSNAIRSWNNLTPLLSIRTSPKSIVRTI